MLLADRVESFLTQRPYCVLVRAALQRMLDPAQLDQMFRDTATRQNERELLFSALVEVMALVVTRVEPSVLASYRSLRDVLGVSDEAVYQKLRGVETLGYPKAALFAFCVALLLQNTFSMLGGSLRSAHGTEKVDSEVSGVLLAQEVRKAYDGMMVQIPPPYWEELSTMSLTEYAQRLKDWAARIDLTRYRKTPRGPNRSPPQRKPRSPGGRISTATILSQRKTKK